MSIPASTIVSITPGVLSAGGSSLVLNGVIVTQNSSLPYGAPTAFASATAVSRFFGANSDEYAMASVYFNGFDKSNVKPNNLYFHRYANEDIAAFIRGALNTHTLDEFKATTGSLNTLYIVTDGSTASVSSVTLSGATSLDNVAELITSAFTGATAPTITYNAVQEAFVATSDTTGDTSTIAYATGTLASMLGFTASAGAVISQGVSGQSPTQTMDTLKAATQNWAAFTLVTEPDLATKKLFGAWTAAQSGRYLWANWDTDANAIASHTDENLSSGNYFKQNEIGGIASVYNAKRLGAFVLGAIASIDFTETNGRITMAFKSQSGLLPTVTDETVAANLIANGYNFYGSYGMANDTFVWFYNGSISGNYNWIDPYVDAIWLNNEMQLAVMTLFSNTKSIPYNEAGNSLIRAALQDPINAALANGVIRAGVALSAAQIAEVNSAAGKQIDTTISSQGYYLLIGTASAATRAARQSPPITLFYTDGGSVQKINVASIDIQ